MHGLWFRSSELAVMWIKGQRTEFQGWERVNKQKSKSMLGQKWIQFYPWLTASTGALNIGSCPVLGTGQSLKLLADVSIKSGKS